VCGGGGGFRRLTEPKSFVRSQNFLQSAARPVIKLHRKVITTAYLYCLHVRGSQYGALMALLILVFCFVMKGFIKLSNTLNHSPLILNLLFKSLSLDTRSSLLHMGHIVPFLWPVLNPISLFLILFIQQNHQSTNFLKEEHHRDSG
jgi:hypothetical protein